MRQFEEKLWLVIWMISFHETLLWDIFMRLFDETFLWDILTRHFYDIFWLNIMMRHFHEIFWWDIWMRHFDDTFWWDILQRHFGETYIDCCWRTFMTCNYLWLPLMTFNMLMMLMGLVLKILNFTSGLSNLTPGVRTWLFWPYLIFHLDLTVETICHLTLNKVLIY